ncbi:SDR family oxidoreductase [Mucilaginibacter boryungensis]|uniref:SDR family oxidoreductase n=1 Tax=Mucilaginibacter boryungensis TaxID=768480 RepID=A0ABR9XGC2_9SPHI|nr:SDR family oxidoreductase [Mucilaginibacter boryungensis]MBE9666034.1 SDR family oxidoreductase [Mucilaginibacter boryungensis]
MPIKTTVITGATSGIGKETALALAQKDHAVYMLVRNVEKGKQVRNEIIAASNNRYIHVIYCDLADLKTVKAATEILKEKLFAINVLINNAGGIFATRELSEDGYEMTFAANHLGHFLLTMSLMPLLEKGQARIINVSSEAHRIGKLYFDDLQAEKEYSSFKRYGMAKLFNIYFAKSLAERYQNKGITAFALHPGMVSTAFWAQSSGWAKVLEFISRPFMITAQQGAQTSVYLATAPKLDKESGQYFKKQHVAKPSSLANNKSARDQLWDISTQLTKAYL